MVDLDSRYRKIAVSVVARRAGRVLSFEAMLMVGQIAGLLDSWTGSRCTACRFRDLDTVCRVTCGRIKPLIFDNDYMPRVLASGVVFDPLIFSGFSNSSALRWLNVNILSPPVVSD